MTLPFFWANKCQHKNKVVNNSDEIMTDQFDDFCKDTTDLFPTKFRPPSEKLWIYSTPTKHGLFFTTAVKLLKAVKEGG